MSLVPIASLPLARTVVAGVALALAATVGAVINGWRLDAAHQRKLGDAKDQIHELELAVGRQNAAAQLLKQQTESAQAAQARAEREAQSQRTAARLRDDWIASLKGSCAENMRDAWGRM